jgi:hypothetical protein
MPRLIKLLQDTAFGPEVINAMNIALQDVLLDLNLTRSDPRAEIVLKAIIESARTGERNPSRLRAMTLQALRRK